MVILVYCCDTSVNKEGTARILTLHTFYALQPSFFIVVINLFTLFTFLLFHRILYCTRNMFSHLLICKFLIFIYCRLILNIMCAPPFLIWVFWCEVCSAIRLLPRIYCHEERRFFCRRLSPRRTKVFLLCCHDPQSFAGGGGGGGCFFK